MNAILLTVPLISLVACLSLFGYAFFVQGFGVKARHDSVTYLDQRNQVGVNRGLHSMFCGLHPGAYTFSNQELVFPATDQSENRLLHRQTDDESIFSGGSIQPRRPHQVSTVQTFESNQGIAFDISDTQVRASNGFSDDIQLLMFKANNKFYMIEDFVAGETQAATEVLKSAMKFEFATLIDQNSGSILTKNKVAGPAGYNRLNASYVPLKNWGINNYIINLADVSALDNAKTYMAVFDSFELAEPIQNKHQELSGTHVVIGKW